MGDELVHYGIKGMKWGQRRSKPGKDIKVRTPAERAKIVKRRRQITSAVIFGVRYRKQIATGARVIGALGSLALGVAVQSVAQRAETNRGRAAAANVFGLPSQASSGPSATKPNRKNVYNISSF